jgi:ubiquinone/menaquinone biosynthesis C-methylase UbiE
VLLASIRSRAPGAELHGVDLTPQMLARARRRLGPGVTLRQASARSLPYPDDHFDAVASSSMLHYLAADAPLAVREWRRVLRPGGRLVVTDWCADHRGTRAQSWLLEHVLRRPYAALSQAALLGLLADAGLRAPRLVRYSAGGAWGLMTVSARRPETPPAGAR